MYVPPPVTAADIVSSAKATWLLRKTSLLVSSIPIPPSVLFTGFKKISENLTDEEKFSCNEDVVNDFGLHVHRH